MASDNISDVSIDLFSLIQYADADATLELRRTLLSSNGVVPPIAEMIRTTQFPVLQNEGVIALTLLAASSDNERGALDIGEVTDKIWTFRLTYDCKFHTSLLRLL